MPHEPFEDTVRYKFRFLQGMTPKTFRPHKGMALLFGSAAAGTVLCALFITRSIFYNPDVNLGKGSQPFPWNSWSQKNHFKWMKTMEKSIESKSEYPQSVAK